MSSDTDLEVRDGQAQIRDIAGNWARADRIRNCRFCRQRLYTIADGRRHECFDGGDSR
ncbi:hypothetical protein [Natronococcus pandeyae]|uniref:hypothetical protein n=1 Tax=Natronococcus pandeyae TaxID=2055836 RepID=UPI001652C9FA|nr:hypothetical protein [Natronococcus pandeyae]